MENYDEADIYANNYKTYTRPVMPLQHTKKTYITYRLMCFKNKHTH